MARRVFWIVLDGVGAGAAPDAARFGDEGANTLAHCAESYTQNTGREIELPNLSRLGLALIAKMPGVPAPQGTFPSLVTRAAEMSGGKDTTSGHWEMAGLTLKENLATFPEGFPEDAISEWVKECGLPGILGNQAASGTEIIERLGREHVKTLKPILYTSADSVWQVAAHETAFGLQRLYDICKKARSLCDRLRIGRVIARPFVGQGTSEAPFRRTYHRKDLSMIPPGPTYLELLNRHSVATRGIGKISSIFAGKGIQSNLDTEGNQDGIKRLIQSMDQERSGLTFCNLIDFDMLYGHRRDPVGFAQSLMEFDEGLGEALKRLTGEDLLVITADHGNDPTAPGTDHTREFVPVILANPFWTPGPRRALDRSTFADIGATVFEWLLPHQKATLGGHAIH